MSGEDRTPSADDSGIEGWLNDRAARFPRTDRDPILREVISSIPTTHQRRRWWPFRWVPLGRGATRSASIETRPVQGRFISMFSATKVMATIAIVSLGSSALLSAALQPDEGSVPGGAAIEPPGLMKPAVIKGTIDREPTSTVPFDPRVWPDGKTSSGERQEGITVETDDPRFTGTQTITFYNRFSPGGLSGPGMFWGEHRIENDQGAWEGTLTGAGSPLGRFNVSSTLIGEGAYEGLFAIVYISALGSAAGTLDGVIMAGEPPLIE